MAELNKVIVATINGRGPVAVLKLPSEALLEAFQNN